MPETSYISKIGIGSNDFLVKDEVLTTLVAQIIEAIGANNNNVADRINNLHSRSFDAQIKITSANESEISNIIDGLYKVQYITITGEGDDATETLNNSAILIQKGTNQYLIKDGQISSRTKTNNVWSTWISISGLPQVSSADNGKILMVINGQWQLVSPSVLYTGQGVPNDAQGNNGDLYMQTD